VLHLRPHTSVALSELAFRMRHTVFLEPLLALSGFAKACKQLLFLR
jgi:hypothetical protein